MKLFRPELFVSDLAALRERHTAELLRTLGVYHGATCGVCGAVVELSGGPLPTLTVCRHVLRAIDSPHPTAELGVVLVGVMPWD